MEDRGWNLHEDRPSDGFGIARSGGIAGSQDDTRDVRFAGGKTFAGNKTFARGQDFAGDEGFSGHESNAVRTVVSPRNRRVFAKSLLVRARGRMKVA